MRFSRLVVLGLATVTFPALTALVQAQHSITPLAKVKFVPDDDVKCLSYALESGDPDKGASTIILKAPPRCLVRWHFHTAVEGLMVRARASTHGNGGRAGDHARSGRIRDHVQRSQAPVRLYWNLRVHSVCDL